MKISLGLPDAKKKLASFADVAHLARKNRELNIPVRVIIDELVAGGLLSEESAKLSRAVIKDSVKPGLGALAQMASKEWVNQLDKDKRLSSDFLARWLAGKLGMPFYRIDSLELDAAVVTNALHYKTAQRYQVLPVQIGDDFVTVATTEPFNQNWHDEIHRQTKRNPRLVIADPTVIKDKIEEVYNLARFVGSAAGSVRTDPSAVRNLEQLLKVDGSDADSEQNIVKIVDWLLQYAIKEKASDIHIEPKREKVLVRLRIDGLLNTVYSFPGSVGASLTSRLKILGRMNIAEKRKPQDGRIKTLLPGGLEVELRLSTMPTTFGEKMVMRIFDPNILESSFVDLGLDPREVEVWQRLIQNRHGIILVTGPTGSGKTTTLYTSLRSVATSQNNVCTIEDPIEMVDPTFNQMQVMPQIDLTFSQGVRTLLRQDPDIIMIGEIRDYETAEIACQSSLTGHLVFSTLHTNDSASAVIRMLELGVPYYMIKATVIGIVAQRLLRVLCPVCKELVEEGVSDEDWKSITQPFRVPKPEKVYRAKGCEKCRLTGYQGRKGIYEILETRGEVLRLITADTDLEALRRAALKQGTHHLRLCGAKMLGRGLTTLDEVMRTCPVF
ncbi:MAG: Flp pilus assembly complex ATPase component TadA [Proteobacteria bacterium]|nr:Flp pilus assembly complex ATPase component TadA [Pseudomonadota bacterium]